MRVRISGWRTAGAVLVLAAAAARAEWSWNPLEWGRERPVEALILCGNIPAPRILAEVAQQEKGVPVLLVAPSHDAEQLYLLTSGGDVLPEVKTNLLRLVRTVRAEHVVVLGDSAYLPAEQMEPLLANGTVVTIVGDDWEKNALALGKFLDCPGLADAYREALLRVKEKTGTGGNAPRVPAPAPVPATPAAWAPEIAPPAAPAPPLPATLPPVIPGEPVVPPRLSVPPAAAK